MCVEHTVNVKYKQQKKRFQCQKIVQIFHTAKLIEILQLETKILKERPR